MNKILVLIAAMLVVAAGGYAANDKALNVRDSGFALDYDGDVVLKAKSVRVKGAADGLTTAAKPISLDLPAGSVVTEIYVNVIKAEATAVTKTIDVGISGGDEDGLLDGISVATTGVKKGTLTSSGQTLGALLRADETGSSGFVPEPYVNASASTVCVTAGSVAFSEFEGDIIIIYKEITQ